MKKLHHLILPSFDLASQTPGSPFTLTDRASLHHLTRVLKLTPGECCVVGDGKGVQLFLELTDVGIQKLSGIVREVFRGRGESKRSVALCIAVLKRDSFEWAVQKAVEVGVTTIVPLLTERTVKTGFNKERLMTIIREAVEQSERSVVPKLYDPMKLGDAFTWCVQEKHMPYWCDTPSDFQRDSSFVGSQPAAVFIGPEGGWSEAERLRAHSQNVQTLLLTPTVLRAETAATLACFALLGQNE